MDIKYYIITEASINVSLQLSKIEQKRMFIQLKRMTDKTVPYISRCIIYSVFLAI